MLGFNPIAGAPVSGFTSAASGPSASGIGVGTGHAAPVLDLQASGIGIGLGNATGINSAVSRAAGLGESFGQAFALYPEYTAWEPEVKLVDVTGPPILELDAAFEQAGRIVVAAERLSQSGQQEVWIYWFNPTLGFFTFEKFALGRNPRALLDDPFDTTNSDVMVFYVRLPDQRICYRQQRDRYAIEIETPIVAEPHSYVDVYLQDVVKDRSGRLVVVYALHDVAAGTYQYGRLESALYPQHLDVDNLTALPVQYVDGILRPAVLNIGVDGPEGYITWDQFTALPTQFLSGLIQKPLIEVGPPGSIDGAGDPFPFYNEIDQFTGLATNYISGTLVQVLFDNTLFDVDQYTASITFLASGSSIIKIVIDVALFDIDQYTGTLTYIAAGSSLA